MSQDAMEADRLALVAKVKSGNGKWLFSELTKGMDVKEITRVRLLLLDAHKRDEVVICQEDGDEDALILGVGPG